MELKQIQNAVIHVPPIALYFTGGRVKYFEQPMEMKENKRGVIEGPGR